MDYEKPRLTETDPIKINNYLYRLVEQLNEHETLLKAEIEKLKEGQTNGFKE